ncbi:MAG TPA: diguanylate cyclase [Ideonella sp.]|uniref:GGDEF domain-containing protein n=1 Tax=Ideonella sp. TaxID=1929293 RepID=UPI002D1680DE|nr:diguanylate cyclase [Ideonella sp.]HSI49388.1 diguanylate cyclase [Ideonella sp.]
MKPSALHHLLLALAFTLNCGLAQAVPEALAADDIGPMRSMGEQMEAWVQRGEDVPEQVLAEIAGQGPAPAGVPEAAWQRALQRTRGLVAARSGLEAEVRAAVAALQLLNSDGHNAQIQADQALVQALLQDLLGHAEMGAQQARSADVYYTQACGVRLPPADCEHRAWWRALRLMWLRAEAQGALIEAQGLTQRAHALAARADDALLQAWTLSGQAVISQALGDADAARRTMVQADRIARRSDSALALVRVRYNEARLALMQGDDRGGLRTMQEALALAKPLNSPRLDSQVLASLSDLLRRAGRAREALAAVERAYPVMKRHNELRGQPTLLHNGGLARLQLGQVAQGRSDLEDALAMWSDTGAKAAMESALREDSDALAALGDTHAALELYHREQALRADINKGNREAALAQQRERYRSEAERRELDLLGRENALRASRLQTQALLERVWLLAAALLLLAAGVAVLLLKRARDANQQLRRSEALLKVQSERDPLTGLANRRHFREVLATLGNDGGFRGALLLLDIDHFKRVNDDFGHQAGDTVLIEIAHRLGSSVRLNDLVCRWGGEEFLVYAPGLRDEGLTALARRMLHAVGDQPVRLEDGRDLTVTTSLGYACFPLPQHEVNLDWDRAVNLVDMALYTAKSMGRDRAVGLQATLAEDGDALVAMERDFEMARLSGEVQLRIDPRITAPAAASGSGT